MIRVRKILFPTDFSQQADEALLYALYLAERYEAELHMLHVIVLHAEDPYSPAHHFPDVESAHEKLQQLAAERMDASLAAHDTDRHTIKRVQQRGVAAAPAIVDYAREADVDLIVMSTHGRRGFRHLLLGSITEEVVRRAPCPVLTVRTEAAAPPHTAIKHVLVPIDFSEHAREALTVARYVAEKNQATLQLLHVLEEALHPAFYQLGAMSIKDVQPDIMDKAEAALRKLFQETTGPAVEAEAYATEGHVSAEIVRFAEEQGSDLIVISSHGLSGLSQFFLGSVTEKVVRRAPCPVLVLKAFERSLLTP